MKDLSVGKPSPKWGGGGGSGAPSHHHKSIKDPSVTSKSIVSLGDYLRGNGGKHRHGRRNAGGQPVASRSRPGRDQPPRELQQTKTVS